MQRWINTVIFVTLLCLVPSSLFASIVKGKVYYSKVLKPLCGFDGKVMGKKHTMHEWKYFYDNHQLALAIKMACPQAPEISDPNDLLNLYHFLSSFASDSGNVPACN